jgi:two-component system sensor histidine kinase and response regulator WspE
MSGQDFSDFSMLDLFRAEAEAQAQVMTEGLLAIERDPAAADHLEACMRAAHSIKGAARIVDLEVGVEIAHVMEEIMVSAQAGRIVLHRPEIDLLLRGMDLLLTIGRAESETKLPMADVRSFLLDAQRIVAGEGLGEAPAPVSMPESAPPEADEDDGLAATQNDRRATDSMLRLSAANLNRLLGLASESLIESRRLRPFADKLLRLKRMSGTSVTAVGLYREALPPGSLDDRTRALLDEAEQRARANEQFVLDCLSEIEAIDQRATGLSQRLYDEALACRMRPFDDGMGRFPRMVRDLARDLGKQVRLEISGRSTSIDRDISDLLDAPLGHLLRNAIDHGVETPDERLRAGKPAEAVIRVEAHHSAGLLHVSVSDDGHGIDLRVLREALVRRGLTDEATAGRLSEAELMEFLFLPGFSMKGKVTDVSGRGVGLDAVQAMARQVRGVVRASIRDGGGMMFQFQLPLTLSVVRVLLVEIGGEPYAFPLASVVRALTVARSGIEAIEGRQHFAFDGARVGLVTAHQLFDRGEPDLAGEEIPVVIVRNQHDSYGVVIDRFIGERELVVQPLDARLGKVPDIEAAALAEDGTPILVIDVADLIRSIEKLTSGGRLRTVRREARDVVQQHRKRVLVVDDSLTVREVERKLLAQHGYEVEVSVDGMDGWNAVRAGQFDLVVTDVDMPRMDGIELVTLIRQDHRLSALPVMIVSYKDREEDRRRGLEAGADHYLAKSSFHDAAMLQAVIDLIGEPDA